MAWATFMEETMSVAVSMPESLTLAEKQALAANWFRSLRDSICAAFEDVETEAGSTAKFTLTPWQRAEGGGGEMGMMKGRIFEKVGVNISTVHGVFSEQFRAEIPGATEDPQFWASGISLVAHMCSPLVPAAHFNTRMIVTGDGAHLWFGGGGDLNPMFPIDADTREFHAAFKHVCDDFSGEFYPAFRDWCKEYFYIKHRGEERGVGGIFYDYLALNALSSKAAISPPQMGKGGVHGDGTLKGMQVARDADLDWNEAFAFTKQVGEAFRQIYPNIIRRHMVETWTPEQREHQLRKRGRYAEYNLLYDRGTRFGLMTGGNPEAILMSLPPEAKWD